ncbi:hypothetical protein CAEBREN_09282 [Caenorhabditis brenneri]|uniref:F-box domain-containing protein n=1 Tax=Caenorhabditis brenneri TaxID=135651 RepID=G0PHS5_CAEBE|nr:hypothetical protein CAEBREN_09282 [Caenorhabditis brenneri]
MNPNEKVFENSFLLEQILSHALSDIVAAFNFRLINKKFNKAFLVVLRKEFRSMDIKIGAKTQDNVEFYFNGRELANSKISQFFQFLNKVANVRVENLTMRNMNVRDVKVWKALHDAIHSELIGKHRQSIRKFVGVERLCKDCEDCLAIAKTAEEYGPIKLSTLRRLERVEHSRKLIITSE